MIVHFVLDTPITAAHMTVDTALLKQLQQRYAPKEFQLWGFVQKTDVAQKERLETKLEQALSTQLACTVECILLEETAQLSTALREVDRYMHWLAMHEPFEAMGLYVPQMDVLQQAVLIEGVKTFEDRFHSLYDDFTQHYTESPLQQSWLQLFQQLVHEFDYVSALELLATARLSHSENVQALLTMQYARLNFDFETASLALATVTMQPRPLLLQTRQLLEALTGPEREEQALAQITELYRHTKIMLIKEDWSSFLTRFYRAREAVLRFLTVYGANRSLHPRSKSILALIDQLEEDFEERRITNYYGAYFYTKSANVTAALTVRNTSFIGHSRHAIHVKRLCEGYYGHRLKSSQMPARFLADTKIMLRDLGRDLDDNMEQMNQLIIEEITKAVEGITL